MRVRQRRTPLFEAAAWPAESYRAWLLPAALVAVVGRAAGPRAGAWQLAAWGVSPVGEAVKRVIDRPRPLVRRLNPFDRASTPSFPSTHASNYVATLGFAVWILRRRRSRLALPVALAALPLIGLIGPSRIHTGDHRLSDVAAGYGLGAGFLGLLIALARRDRALDHGVPRAPAARAPGSP